MNSIKFISENPFRLLGLGSNISYTQLVKKAEAASRAQKVGLAMPVACERAFGSEELIHCVEIVRSLVNEARTQTLYRLFWPAHYNMADETDGSLDELQKLANGEAGDGNFPQQALFILNWATFENEPSVESLNRALTSFNTLSGASNFDGFLAGMLQPEDGDEAARQVIVHESKRLAVSHMFGRACAYSATLLKAGELDAGLKILDAIAASGFESDVIDKAFIDHIAPFGDREMEALKAVIEASDESEEAVVYNPKEFELLERLAKVLEAYVPSTSLWKMTIDERISQSIEPIREQAVAAANERDDYEEARRLLLSTRELPLPHSMQLKINQDLAALQEVVESKELWEGVTPIDSAPSMFTLNGFGAKMYGRRPFAGNPAWYFSTYYIVFIFIPVFPIRQYLVSDAVGGGWHFYGKAPLNKGHKYHMAISVIVLFCLIAFANLDSKGNRGYYSSPSYSSTDGVPYSGFSGGADTSGVGETFQSRRARLREEMDNNTKKIFDDNATLTSEKAMLDSLKADLEKEHNAILEQEKKLNKSDKAAVSALKVRTDELREQARSFVARVDKYDKLDEEVAKLSQRNDTVMKALHDMGD